MFFVPCLRRGVTTIAIAVFRHRHVISTPAKINHSGARSNTPVARMRSDRIATKKTAREARLFL
jgi:hypothetical protein